MSQIKSRGKRLLSSLYRMGSPIHISSMNALGVKKTVLQRGQLREIVQKEACEYLQLQSYVPHKGCTVQQQPTYYSILENAKLDIKRGLVQATNGSYILEGGVDDLRIQGLLKTKLPQRARLLKGTYSTIWGQYTHNYGHWMIECLTRLYSAELVSKEYPLTLLMPDDLSYLQQESFDACLPETISVEYVERTSLLKLEKFIFLSMPTSGTSFFLVDSIYLEFIRQGIFKHYNIEEYKAKKAHRIYIVRNRAQYRHILNEQKVIQCLEGYGFQPYVLEEMTLGEQARLFSQAEFIISPHSSGLVNCIFAPSGIPVLEISGLAPEPSFFFLAMSRNQSYYYMFGMGADKNRQFPNRYSQPSELRGLINSDFDVSISELTANVEKILKGMNI